MLEVTQVNVYILYVLSHSANSKKISLRQFKDQLIEELISYAVEIILNQPERRISGPKASKTFERFEGDKHLVYCTEQDRNCVVCSKPAKRKHTNFLCNGCSNKPHLCPKNCFAIYHTK